MQQKRQNEPFGSLTILEEKERVMDISTGKIILGTVGGAITAYLGSAIKFVPKPYNWVIEINLQGETKVIVWKPGLHLLWIPAPPFMRITNKVYCSDQPVIVTIGKNDNNPGEPDLVEFKDSSAGVTVQLIIRVVDPVKATYEVENYFAASIKIIESYLRRMFSEYTLDNAMQSEAKERIIQGLDSAVRESLENWGVILSKVDITDFSLSDDVIEQRNKILVAEKEKEATITKAKGEAKAKKIKAAADAIAKKLVATGEGKAEWIKIQSIASKLKIEPTRVISYLISASLIDALDSSTVILTSGEKGINLPDMAATMAAVQQAMNKPKGE